MLSLVTTDNRTAHHILKRDLTGVFSLDGAPCGLASTVGEAINHLKTTFQPP